MKEINLHGVHDICCNINRLPGLWPRCYHTAPKRRRRTPSRDGALYLLLVVNLALEVDSGIFTYQEDHCNPKPRVVLAAVENHNLATKSLLEDSKRRPVSSTQQQTRCLKE